MYGKNIAALFSIMDLDFLMRFYDLLVAKEKGTFTAHGGLWASLLQGDQPCLVPEPAPIEAGQFSPHPPAVGASFWLCAGVPGPRLLPLIVRSLCSACPLCPTPWATARPHPDRCFYDLSFSESPAWRSRSSISEPSVLIPPKLVVFQDSYTSTFLAFPLFVLID